MRLHFCAQVQWFGLIGPFSDCVVTHRDESVCMTVHRRGVLASSDSFSSLSIDLCAGMVVQPQAIFRISEAIFYQVSIAKIPISDYVVQCSYLCRLAASYDS